LLLPLAAARGAEDGCAGVRGEFTASRGFSGSVRRAQAESAALAAALLSAYEYAGHMLSAEYVPDFPDAAARLGVPGEALFEGLACALFPARRLEARVDGFPPNLRVTVGVVLGDPGASTPAEALKDADRLESGRRMVVRLRAELARYDVAADKLLGRRPDTPEDGEATRALRWAAERMKALEILRDILSRCGQEDPHRLDEELAEALRLAPDDPLLLTLSAGNRLLLDSPAGALEQADAALVLAPDFARAHDTRGVALMRQGLPSLAADAFGRASALAPDNPAYLVHRASACFVLKEKKGMCADFRAACSLGDCEGLTWALDAGECPRF
jgi:tetratricopeptide (TPR) repeat protein